MNKNREAQKVLPNSALEKGKRLCRKLYINHVVDR